MAAGRAVDHMVPRRSVVRKAGGLVVKRPPHRPRASRVAAADRVRAEIERDPDATMAEIAARAECSISLVSKVKAGER